MGTTVSLELKVWSSEKLVLSIKEGDMQPLKAILSLDLNQFKDHDEKN